MTVTPRAAADEHLANDRLDFLDRFAEAGVVARHIAPAEQHLPLVLDRALDLVFAGEARGRLLRQKHHADAVLTGRRQLDALPRHFFAKERVGNLNQDAGTVAGKRVGANRAAVGQVLQDLQALLDDRVRFRAFDMRDKADATRIVFVGGIVQSLGTGRVRHALTSQVKKGRVECQPASNNCKDRG